MAKEEKTKLESVPKPGALAIPSYMKQGDSRGKETMSTEDMRMPRLVVAQGLSPQLNEADPTYIEDLKPGYAFNDLTNEIYGKGPLKAVIVRADKPRWMLFDDDRAVIEPNYPANGPKTKWTTDAEGHRQPPEATMFFDYVILLGEAREPMGLSFKSSGIKTAMRLNGLIAMKPVPIFACYYEFNSISQKNDKGAWYVLNVKQAGFVDEEMYKFGEKMFDNFKNKDVAFEATPDPISDPDAPGAEAEM